MTRWKLGVVVCLFGLGCGEEPARNSLGRQSAAATSTPAKQPTCITLGLLPGSDPNKQTKTVCKTFVAQPAPASVVAKQQLYVAQLTAMLAGPWKGLSAADRTAKARALKDSIFATGGQP